jgi:hypothetical protein
VPVHCFIMPLQTYVTRPCLSCLVCREIRTKALVQYFNAVVRTQAVLSRCAAPCLDNWCNSTVLQGDPHQGAGAVLRAIQQRGPAQDGSSIQQ